MQQSRKNNAAPDAAHTRGALRTGASRTPRIATGIGSCAALGEVLPPSLRRRQRQLCPPPSCSGSPRIPPRGTRGRSGKGRARSGAAKAAKAATGSPGPGAGRPGTALKVTPRGGGSRRPGTPHATPQHTIRHAMPCHPPRSVTDHCIPGGKRGTVAPAPGIQIGRAHV